MRAVVFMCVVSVVTLGLAVVLCAQNAPSPKSFELVTQPPISFHNRVLMNRALVHNEAEVTVLLAIAPGRGGTVRHLLEKLGGTVQFTDNKIGYVRVKLHSKHMKELISSAAITAFQLDSGQGGWSKDIDTKYFSDTQDSIYKSQQVQTASAIAQRSIDSASAANKPLLSDAELRGSNAYISTRDMGVAGFLAEHPTFDGRGVTIASIESAGVAFTHPSLQRANSLDGKATRKIIGILNPSDPSDLDYSKVLMDTEFAAHENRFLPGVGTFNLYAKPYTLPHAGTYRLGYFNHSAGLQYTVLWELASGTVWVDTNRDRSFADEQPMADVNIRMDIGRLRFGESANNLGDRNFFVVTVDAPRQLVHIYLATGGHATMSASVAAGSASSDGLAYGMAPGAQLLLVDDGNSIHSYIEAFILAARHPAVDIITSSAGGSASSPTTSEELVATLLDRITRAYRKPIFRPAGNVGGAIEYLGFDGGTKVLTIGGYVNRDSASALFGLNLSKEDWVVSFSSRGPTLDGGLKPDLIVPAHHISADLCSNYDPSHPVDLDKYRLPPCYRISSGTSATTPVAAGAAALLVSAAKQSGVSYDADRLIWALRSGARFMPDWSAHEQGAGLLQVGRAWELLKKKQALPEIRSKGTISHTFSQYLREPGVGLGIYEREGWVAGQTGVRNIELTSLSGPGGTQRYGVTWLGNDGTFQAPAKVELSPGKPTRLPIKIHPQLSGVHAAILNLTDQNTGMIVHQLMITVVAADEFSSGKAFSVQHEGELQLMDSNAHFVRVPEGAGMMRIDLQVISGRLAIKCGMPSFDAGLLGSFMDLYPSPNNKYRGVGTWSFIVPQPKPGAWALRIENGNTISDNPEGPKSPAPARYHLTATVLGVSSGWENADSSSAPPAAITDVSLINQMGALKGGVIRGQIGSAYRTTSTFAGRGESRLFEIKVDPKTSTLLVQAKATGTHGNLELYLYDCSSGYCFMHNFAVPAATERSIVVRNPSPGKWKAVVSPGSSSSGTAPFEYVEVITNPKYGGVKQSAPAARNSGEKWTQRITFERSAASVGIREPVMLLEVFDQFAEDDVSDHFFGSLRGQLPKNRPVSLITLVQLLSRRPYE